MGNLGPSLFRLNSRKYAGGLAPLFHFFQFMVFRYLPAPFPDPACQRLFDAVAEALHPEEAGPNTLLLGHLPVGADAGPPLDAVVLRPHGITLLVFVPRGGRLSIPALGYGSWLLDGTPLAGRGEFDNPFEQVVQQKKALEAWLALRLSSEQANLRFISGIVVFGAPVTFGPDVEPALNSAAANGFQLLTNPAELPRRLRQLATPEIDLRDEDLAAWVAGLASTPSPPAAPALDEPLRTELAHEEVPTAEEPDVDDDADDNSPAAPGHSPPGLAAAPAGAPTGFLAQKARQLWGWLGAADIPDDDPPYGHDPAAVASRREEKEQLEQIRQQMQADVAAQLQALEARESERERNIAQLRSELAQAPPVAAEAAALVSRLGAETREKAALEAAMEASRAESAARNQELDAKIQQLSQLIERLHAQPAAPRPAGGAGPAPGPVPGPARRLPVDFSPAFAFGRAQWGARLRQLRGWRRRAPRLAAVAGAVAVVGLLGWGVSHLSSPAPVPYQQNGQWGYADASGTPVVPAQFTAAGPFQAGRAVVAKDGAYGFIDRKGKEVVPPAYDALNPFAGGYARARVGDTYTFIDEDGQEFDHYYFNALDFAEGHAAVLDHRGWYYITGPEEPAAAPVIFLEAYSFTGGLARVRLADGYTYITPAYLQDPSRGTKPFGRYDLASDFVEGKARVTQGGRSFVIDRGGDEVK
ncbi:MAG: hypothetical protein NVSMB30_23510 [Hymenobacter sp.]